MYTISDVYKQENLVLSYQRLVTNPESTYKDFFRDTYSTYAMALDKNICFLRSKVKAGYLPATSIRTFMPKANGLSRMYTLLTIEDQIVYQAYANVIAEALFNISQIRNRYKKSVFGNLYAGKGSIFFYQKWQDSYKAYTKSIIKSYERGNKYIASFDLTACYDSINHRLLYDILTKKCHLSDNCAKSFVQLLEKWESADRMELGTGIPQGPQASGIIAESVLAEYDSFIEGLQKNLSFQYFRYVDDIRILAKDERTVQCVLFLLDIKSKELGLFPQSSKIVIHEITNIDEEIKRISKPLFDDEFDDDKNAKTAVKAIQKMLKEDPADLTTIKRYFRYVKQDSKSNKLAISAVRKYPNMIHSFAYYVKRYPRKVPQIKNTLVFAVITGPISYFLCFIVAWFVNELTPKLRAFMTLLFYAPALSGVTAIWQLIFSGDQYGYLNSWLTNLGIIQTPILWLTDQNYMKTSIIIVVLWASLGVGFLSFIAGFQNVDRSLYEAGAVDGIKNRFQELWFITLPAMKGQLLFSSVMAITSSFNIGDIISVLCGFPSSNYAAHTIMNHLQDYGSIRYEMGYACAIATVLFALMVGSNTLVQKMLSKVGS